MRDTASEEVDGFPEDDSQGCPLAYMHMCECTHSHLHTCKYERLGGETLSLSQARHLSMPCRLGIAC